MVYEAREVIKHLFPHLSLSFFHKSVEKTQKKLIKEFPVYHTGTGFSKKLFRLLKPEPDFSYAYPAPVEPNRNSGSGSNGNFRFRSIPSFGYFSQYRGLPDLAPGP